VAGAFLLRGAAVKAFWAWLSELDRILRGEATRLADLRDGRLRFSLPGVLIVLLLLAMLAGACTGFYALINHNRPLQTVAAVVKVPALYLLTLLVTFPSLYVFNALVGSRLTVASLFRLFIAALAVNMAVVASLGPIVAFFAINTTSYGFMVLLNVAAYAVSGLLSLIFLMQSLRRINLAMRGIQSTAPGETSAEPHGGGEATQGESNDARMVEPPGPLDRLAVPALGGPVRIVFILWMIVFGLVGAQMSWVLRPFIGAPQSPFEWFRARESNFFEAVWRVATSLFT